MSTAGRADTVYTIPAGEDFARALARGLLAEVGTDYPALARMMIFLPTRRAARILQDAFFDCAAGRALLLPRIHVIGSYDEDDLALLMAGHGDIADDIPPAIDPLYRQALLAQLIRKVPGRSDTLGQAMELAGALAHLMDQVYTEGLDLKNLADLVPEDFATHWQITLDFLKILSEYWPAILSEKGLIDPAARRDSLIRRLTDHWLKHPPSDRVIVAGSTGSIPATADFLSCVAGLPNGHIVLPGFDLGFDFSSWDEMPFSHPQGGFKKLLSRMGVDPACVKKWPYDDGACDQKIITARQNLAREMMAPDHGTIAWQEKILSGGAALNFEAALSGLHIYDVDTQHEESLLIALWLRKLLIESEKKAILITPDRNLARRVMSVCQRWGIDLDDSAGQPLAKTGMGLFMRQVVDFMVNPEDPVILLSLLKNPTCMRHHTHEQKEKIICEFEKYYLRSDDILSWPYCLSHFDDLLGGSFNGSEDLRGFLKEFIPFIQRHIVGSFAVQSHNLQVFLKGHVFMAVKLIEGCFDESDVDAFDWKGHVFEGDEGHIFQKLIDSFSKLSDQFSDISISDYKDLFNIALNGETVRSRFGVHPRIQILGQMEARITHADVIILGGLNEGVWPEDDSVDPWMSRTMQKQFGLPTGDQSLSLSAHDFVQAFCKEHVVITRSARIGGSTSVPSRWLQKLGVVCDISNVALGSMRDAHFLSWLRKLDERHQPHVLERPNPSPPLDVRPRRLSVTQIEKLLQDPYSIYAAKILSLPKLRPLFDDREAAIKGMILHRALEIFVSRYRETLPDDADMILLGLAEESFALYADNPVLLAYWRPQFQEAFASFLRQETTWRHRYRPGYFEATGAMTLQIGGEDFTLTGRADRIDLALSDDGKAAVIDYKSGGDFTQKALKTGDTPQLPLEALILRSGGFDTIPPLSAGYLGYWYVNASAKGGTATAVDGDFDEIIDQMHDKLVALIEAYNQQGRPYLSMPNPLNMPRYNDYDHLSRAAEWSRNDGEHDGMSGAGA